MAKEKDRVQEKIEKELEKKRERFEGKSRIMEYLRTEHQWENYLFLVVSVVTLVLGFLIVDGTLVIKESFPLIGKHPKIFSWSLVVISFFGLIYALYPFFKPAFPEFKKINWLPWKKFIGNTIRVFLFLIIFTLLFLLYNKFIYEILALFY